MASNMKVTPSPKCASCANYSPVIIDGLSGPVGYYDKCITPEEPFELEGYTPLSMNYDEYFIDGFENMCGECKFYKLAANKDKWITFYSSDKILEV